MTAPPQHAARPDPLEGLLVALARGAGHDPLPHAVSDALLDAARKHPDELLASWLPRLAHAGDRLGLRIAAFECSPAELCARGRQHGLLATWLPSAGDAEPAWLVIDAWLGPKVRIDGSAAHQPGTWIDAETLAALLGLPTADTPALWVLAERAAPATALQAPSSPHIAPTPGARLRALMRLESRDLWAIVIYAIGVGIFTLATPIAVQAVVNIVAFGALLQPLVVLVVLLLGGLVLAGGLRAIQYWVVELLQQRLFVRVVSDLSYRLPRLDATATDRAHGPELVNRFYDVITVQKSAASLLLDGVSVALQAAIGMVVLAFYHPLLLTFDIFLLITVAIVIFGFARPAVATSIKESKIKHEVAAWLEDITRAPLAFKRYGGAGFALQRADELARRYLDARRKHFRYLFFQVSAALTIQATASALLLGLGGWLVIDRQLTLGQLVAAELIVSTVVAAFAKFGKHLESYYDMVAALDKLGVLADLPLETDHGESTPPHPRPIAVTLRAVELSYGGAPVLRGLDLELPAGARVAITGPSAAGKTTLAAVLYGLRQPTSGVITLDGVDLRDHSLASLRRDVALAGPLEIFAGTIVDNVRMDRRDIPLAEVRRVLVDLGLEPALARLDGDLKAPLQVGGAPLSRSEAARLVLARALLTRPRLLVVDELLDGLDAADQARILDLILRDDAPWTALLFTRNPAVLARCERAYELAEGALRPLVR